MRKPILPVWWAMIFRSADGFAGKKLNITRALLIGCFDRRICKRPVPLARNSTSSIAALRIRERRKSASRMSEQSATSTQPRRSACTLDSVRPVGPAGLAGRSRIAARLRLSRLRPASIPGPLRLLGGIGPAVPGVLPRCCTDRACPLPCVHEQSQRGRV